MSIRLRLPVRCLAGAALPAFALAAFAAPDTPAAPADGVPRYGARLERFDYPHPVQLHAFESQGQRLEMAYLDVAPAGPANGRTAVLLHGKNFCAATWEDTIAALADAGWRVIAPDQVGFCKSSKPEGYQFSLDQLAWNTHALLDALDVERATLIGHSMGSMLAARFALNHADRVEQLVLVNPIGLEDWRAKGVPYAPIDALYANELKTDYARIKAYQQKHYYRGPWQPGYDRWVRMLAGMYAGPGARRVAYNQAQTSEMIHTQPVVHEFDRLTVPTVLLIGQHDTTAPGANRAPPEVAKTLGDYPALGRATAARIPGAKLVEFDDLGHAPHIEAPARFHAALLHALGSDVRPPAAPDRK
ncbi:alpha/beta fold hydrolase [Cognatilysobacter bugurensis]|uniref:Hydrolase n=1 Tax=Cognatilysobacter bugurensis TaxID=543356 RepID=A0A918SYU2_9GAMM|nr:alpha/beta hydrolase [Lysobacter bugurensis]GHA79543.1 hydrolase [Lysobacter bugurensis]